MRAYDPQTEELYQIAGDAPDPTGLPGPAGAALRGQQSTMKMTGAALAHPMVRYKDHVLEADLYGDPQSGCFVVHLLCPRCRHALTIDSARKAMSWENSQLSVEKFRCTWELSDQRQAFGLSLCGWQVVIDKNVARDA